MKTFKEFLQLDEAYMHDIANQKEGDIVHPYSRYGEHHASPHTIIKRLKSKTIIQNNNTGEKLHVSHATGNVIGDDGIRTSLSGFSTEAEKQASDERRNKQHEKDDAHTAILRHLGGMQNSAGRAVGTLSPEEHAEILAHLEKLKE